MPYIVYLLIIGVVACLLLSKLSPSLSGTSERKPVKGSALDAYVPILTEDSHMYIPYSEARALLQTAMSRNQTMGSRELNKLFFKEIAEHNKKFLGLERIRCKALLSDVDGKALDQQQISAILTDEDATLVIAGAGTGKTTTLAGKVLYLTEGRGVAPDDILLLAFTNKAADEMLERIRDRMSIPIGASTFHKLGLDIIRSVSDTPISVYDDTTGFIRNFFDATIATDDFLCQDLLEFFCYYLHPPADMSEYDSFGEAYEAELTADFETIKSRMERATFIERETAGRAKSMATLRGEKVKSLQEMVIANFLYLHKVEYEYERPYPFHDTDGKHTTYKPDFYLPDYDIWLEHFGVDRYGRCNQWLSPVEENKYLEGMLWKREMHKKHKTVLLETYSWYVQDGILLSRLETMLRGHGVKFEDRDYESIFRTVYGSVSDRYFSEFINLCSTFLSLFKANGYSIRDLDLLEYKDSKYFNNRYHSDRTKLFLHIVKPLLEAYDRFLDENSMVDFSSMINKAAQYVKEGKCEPHYKYILVDEYQDASVARFNLVKAIADSCGAHVMVVGDDWQSIYRFSGSDISVFTEFSEMFGGHAAVCKIEQTYRNSQQLINCAADFVLKNKNQIPKELASSKQLQQPVVFVNYSNGPAAALKLALDRIIQENGVHASILLLGRTRYDLDILQDSELFSIGKKAVTYIDSPDTPVQFLTVHSAKGLEADSVILLNFNNALMGFPNKISDDVLLQLVLSSADSYPYAEERRLLYVALTRTRTRTYILTNDVVPSEFFKEFSGSPYCEFVSVTGEQVLHVPCPRCKTGHLVIRQGEEAPFLGCSFYPRCEYTVPDISILRRHSPQCSCGGFYVKRVGRNGAFYGCSNYPHCRNTLTLAEYEQKEIQAAE